MSNVPTFITQVHDDALTEPSHVQQIFDIFHSWLVDRLPAPSTSIAASQQRARSGVAAGPHEVARVQVDRWIVGDQL